MSPHPGALHQSVHVLRFSEIDMLMYLVDALCNLTVSLRVLSPDGFHFVMTQHAELAFDFILVPCFEREAAEDGELGLP